MPEERKMTRLSAVLFLLLVVLDAANSATIELARKPDGTALIGVKVEGEIVAGDSLKLLSIYRSYGSSAASRVYLLSKGGNVAEAIKLGLIVRRLRLRTEAPIKDGDGPVICPFVLMVDRTNCICASACFLVYAGGADRSGNYIALHRPYLPKEVTDALSDVAREGAQKREMRWVSNYLQEMEVSQFFIDKMMSTNSQNVQFVSLRDASNYHLLGAVPSIEEIVLTKCDGGAHEEEQFNAIAGKGASATAEEQELKVQLFANIIAGWKCRDDALDDLRDAAWEREHEEALRSECDPVPLHQTPQQCRSAALLHMTVAAMKRWLNAPPGASGPAESPGVPTAPQAFPRPPMLGK